MGSQYTQTSMTYSNNRLTSVTDENGVRTEYSYVGTDVITTVKGESGSADIVMKDKFYDNSDLLKETSVGNIKNEYFYDVNGAISRIKHNNFDTRFSYDSFGNLKSININGVRTLITYRYSSDNTRLDGVDYGNGQSINYNFTNNKLISSSDGVTYSYDSQKRLNQISNAGGVRYNYLYDYEYLNNLYYVENGANRLDVHSAFADSAGNLTATTYFRNGQVIEAQSRAFNDDGMITSINRQGRGDISYTYDLNYRPNIKTTNFVYGASFKQGYTFHTSGQKTSYRMQQNEFKVNDIVRSNLQYTYYSNGNVRQVINGQSSSVMQWYYYDEYDRLSVEYNYVADRLYYYYYDNGGNITLKKEFKLSSNTFIKDYNYGYTNEWKDLMTSFDGHNITYDNIGNPLNYKGNNLTWQNGRQLKSFNGTQMEYDYAGYRTKKGDRTYYWQGDRLIAEDMGGGLFTWYYYDETGICGMYFNGVDMYFQKNIFGDVIAIYNSVGVLQGRYAYDAWGNITSMIDDANNYVVQWNPFRYRGYYYDQDFGLYYLNSRYYDPSTGRFINADEPETLFINGSAVMGVNLFAYCFNNPVMYTDLTGCSVILSLLIAFGIGALVGGVISTVTGLASGKSGWELFGHIAGGALLGGVLGASTALGGLFGIGAIGAKYAGLGLLAATAASFGAGMASYGLQDVWFTPGAKWDWGTSLAHGGVAAVQGAFSFGVGALMGHSGYWTSLNKGQLGTAFKSARAAGSSVVKSLTQATGTFAKNNIGQILIRFYMKGTFATPWGLLRLGF